MNKKNLKKFKKIKSSKIKQVEIRIFKYFIIFIMIISIFLLRNKKENEKKDITNNDWIKGNKTEILEKYISNFKGNFGQEAKIDIERVKDLFSFKVMLKDENSPLNIELKSRLIQKLSQKFTKNITLVKNVFVNQICFFGNRMVALNNIIYYSEILGIKNIYLNSEYDWYIKNDIITDKIKVSVKPSSDINCNSEDTICGHIFFDFFFPVLILPEIRFTILKDEIKRNLPQININKDDLYIYIRAGDSFYSSVRNGYIPSPYCFYERVITKFKFNDIYIISIDDKHPAIGKLISNFPKIKHQKNSVKTDIAILMNAYNLANSMSSFTQAAISFNDNLENLFDYEAYKASETILHFHYDVDKLNKRFNVYRMDPTENYLRNIFNWCNREEQRKMLLEEICLNDLIKTRY
jgi:hypothetical protein